MRAARDVVDQEVRKRMHQSRPLCDHAADGNVDKMKEELQNYAVRVRVCHVTVSQERYGTRSHTQKYANLRTCAS